MHSHDLARSAGRFLANHISAQKRVTMQTERWNISSTPQATLHHDLDKARSHVLPFCSIDKSCAQQGHRGSFHFSDSTAQVACRPCWICAQRALVHRLPTVCRCTPWYLAIAHSQLLLACGRRREVAAYSYLWTEHQRAHIHKYVTNTLRGCSCVVIILNKIGHRVR